ncbi:hypothetical protein B4U79_18993, partial [Dinothrombium tinctorium]
MEKIDEFEMPDLTIVTPWVYSINLTMLEEEHPNIWQQISLKCGSINMTIDNTLISSPRLFAYDSDAIDNKRFVNATNWWNDETHARVYHFYCFLVEFLIPLGIMAPLSILSVQHLKLRISCNIPHSPRTKYSLLALVITFVICWFPYHIHRLINIVFVKELNFKSINVVSYATDLASWLVAPLNALSYWSLHPDYF